MDTRRARIYNGSKKVDAIYKGSSATPMYTWEEKRIVVGIPETIPHGVNTTYESDWLKWESKYGTGVNGIRETTGDIDSINGRQVGVPRNTSTEVVQQPVPAQNIIGTKTLSGYVKSNTATLETFTSTDEYPLRKQVAYSDYKFPVGTEAVVTYRVTGGGISGSHTSGRIAFKLDGESLVNSLEFTAHIDTSDIDASGNPLCVVIASPYTSTVTHYAEYVGLYFSQNITNIYDANIYFEEGEIREKTMTRNRNGSSINIYFPYVNFDPALGDDVDYLASLTVTRVEFVDGSSISGNFPVRAIGTNAITRYCRIDLPDTISNLSPGISSYEINRGRELKITYFE